MFYLNYYQSYFFLDEHSRQEVNAEFFEKDPSNLKVGIEMKNLGKSFKKGVKVVDNLNMKVYNDQVTVLLGHNGAGKTTTISMLTGMLVQSSGTAIYDGRYDLSRDTEKIRQSLGICTQKDILYEELTVEQHLKLFGQLRGVKRDDIEKEVLVLLKAIDLDAKVLLSSVLNIYNRYLY